jgi:Na+/melibiose symporter-like transporter
MTTRRRFRWYYLLLLAPLVLLWVPFYNRLEPSLGGVPFFYWYQMVWIAITAVLTFIVWRLDGRS